MIAKITSARLTTTGPFAGLYLYGWKQQIPKLTVGGYEDPASARFGTVTSDTVYFSPALEINNTSVAVDTIVFMQPRGFTLNEPCFEFQYTPPGGSSAPVSAWKTPAVRAATVAALPSNAYANGSSGVGATITGNSNGALSAQDGVTLSASQDLLVKTEGSASHNGIYTITQLGDGSHPFILTRRTDCDEPAETLNATVSIQEGTLLKDTIWACTANATIVIGTTALPWAQMNGAIGTGTDTNIAIWNGTGVQAIKDSPASITSSLSVAPFAQLRLTGTKTATPGEHPIVDLLADEQNQESVAHLRYILAATTGSAGAGYDVVSSISVDSSAIYSQRFQIRYVVSLTSTVSNICTFWTSGDISTPYTGKNVWDFTDTFGGMDCYVRAHGFIGGGNGVGQTGTILPNATADTGIINSLGTKLTAITPLAGGATLSDVITKVNEIITALQTASITL